MQTLTSNELKLLKLVCRDKDNNQIAEKLDFSLRYTEKIKSSLYTKTRTKSNIGLLKWAVTQGYFSL